MNYHFRNLVFEGGGVKGIAYVGALSYSSTAAIIVI
jgi:NTE family protein